MIAARFWTTTAKAISSARNYAEDYKTYIWKLTPDGKDLVPAQRLK